MGGARGGASCGAYKLRALLGHTSEIHSLVGHSAIDLPDILYHTGENLVPRRTRQDGACQHSGSSTLWRRESHFKVLSPEALFPLLLSGARSRVSHLIRPKRSGICEERVKDKSRVESRTGEWGTIFRFKSHPFVP